VRFVEMKLFSFSIRQDRHGTHRYLWVPYPDGGALVHWPSNILNFYMNK